MATSSEAGIKQAIPFFGVRDISASLNFYLDGLGFKLVHKWTPEGKIRWCMLEIDAASLMLQEFLPHLAPAGTFGLGMSVYFICGDALAFYRKVTAKGIEAQLPFVGNAMWVTSVTDPDGYKLFFESPTDAPEESEYQE